MLAVIGGRFELIEKLSSGGCGEVFLGHDLSSGERVAVKVALESPKAGITTNHQRLRLEHEILSHGCSPHLLRTIEFGEVGSRSYLVLEFVEGGTLGQRFRAGLRADPWSAAAIGIGLARGLQTVHDIGYVHCDVEPGNLLVAGRRATDSDLDVPSELLVAGEKLVLSDLGIAVEQDTKRSTADDKRGTRLYLSPEQAEGGQRLSVRADVYGATAVMVSALTAQLPPEPERFDEFAEALKPKWSSFIRQGMSKDPLVRFPHIQVWLDALLDAINEDLRESGHDAIIA